MKIHVEYFFHKQKAFKIKLDVLVSLAANFIRDLFT